VRLEAANRNFVGTTKRDYEQKTIQAINRNYFGSNQAVQVSIVDFNARVNGYGRCSTEVYPKGCRRIDVGSTQNVVQGNYIGLNKCGTRTLGGFCAPREPKGSVGCKANDLAPFSAYASIYFQTLPEDSKGPSSLRGTVIGGSKPGEGNLMSGSMNAEILLSAPENVVVGNTVSNGQFLPTRGLAIFRSLQLSVGKEVLAVVRLQSDAEVPSWVAAAKGFTAITRTPDELSIVCAENVVPSGVKVEKGFRAFKFEGVLDFSATGLLASVALPLANASISIFAISTFDTDYVMVKENKLLEAIAILRQAGHQVSS
jgi:hypothetical protein